MLGSGETGDQTLLLVMCDLGVEIGSLDRRVSYTVINPTVMGLQEPLERGLSSEREGTRARPQREGDSTLTE